MLQRKLLATVWSVVASVACLSTSAFAGINTFTTIGPDSGQITKVAFHPTNGAIAYASAINGFYRSEDGGVTWAISPCTQGRYIQDFAVDLTDGNRVFIAASAGALLVSTDAGVTCGAVANSPLASAPRNVEVSGEGTLYLASEDQLFRSSDAGVTWQERDVPEAWLPTDSLQVDPLDGNALVAFNDTRGFSSPDGGVSWTSFAFPATTRDLIIPARTPQTVIAATAAGILSSDDKGQTWTSMGLNDAHVLASDPTDPSIIYAGTFPSGLVRSNGPGAWQNIHGNARSGQISSIAISSISPDVILLGGNEGLVRSSMSGGTWGSVNTGITATLIEKMVAAPASQRIYFLTNANGLFALEHGATRAQAVNPEGLIAATPFNMFLGWDLLAHGDSSDQVLVSTNGGIARSNDGGEQWSWIDAAGLGSLDRISAAPPDHPSDIVVSGGAGIYRSTDEGATWQPVAGLPAGSQVRAFARLRALPSIVYAGIAGSSGPPNNASVPLGIFKSVNGGADWVDINGSLPTGYVHQIEIDPHDEETIYLAHTQGIFKSTDGGDSWAAVNLGPLNTTGIGITLDSSRAGTLYVATSLAILRSIDAGVTWEDIYVPAATGDAPGRIFADPFRPHTIIASMGFRGAEEMTLATDVQVEGSTPAALPQGLPENVVFTVRNAGPLHATDVQTVIQLPASARDISATATAGVCTVQSASVACTQSALAPDASTRLTVTFTATEHGDAEIVAGTESSESDLQPSNNTSRHAVTVDQMSDLSITATAPAASTAGSGIAYSFAVANAGPHDATDVVAAIQLAPGLSVATATASSGTCTSGANGLVTCHMATLASGSSATLSISTASAGRGAYITTAAVESARLDPVESNNAAAASTTVNAAPGGGGGGGGGGGSLSWLLLLVLVPVAAQRSLYSSVDPRG